jgi:hypothetical protein
MAPPARARQRDREEDRRGHRPAEQPQPRPPLAQDGEHAEGQRGQQELRVVVGVGDGPARARLRRLPREVRDVEGREAEIGALEGLRDVLEDRHGRQEGAGRQHAPQGEPQGRLAAQDVEHEEVQDDALERERPDPVQRRVRVAREQAGLHHDQQQRHERHRQWVDEDPPALQELVGERDRQQQRHRCAQHERQALVLDRDDRRIAVDEKDDGEDDEVLAHDRDDRAEDDEHACERQQRAAAERPDEDAGARRAGERAEHAAGPRRGEPLRLHVHARSHRAASAPRGRVNGGSAMGVIATAAGRAAAPRRPGGSSPAAHPAGATVTPG